MSMDRVYDLLDEQRNALNEPGLRYNEGKIRYDLLHPISQEGIARVMTKGANKYLDRNWEKGMSWTSVLASMKRHIAAFEKGEDYDPETGELHVDHVQCNAHFLSAFYKIAPTYDDRNHNYLRPNKIGLDIDEVLADWIGHWSSRFGNDVPDAWNFDRRIGEKFKELVDDKDFWLSIPVKTKPSEMRFEPCCYITSRIIPQKWTEEWLDINGFPTVPVYTVGHNMSKVNVAKQTGLNIFVDDRYENFVELNKAGIFTYLFDAAHNRRYDVGYKRIKSLKEIS